MEAKILSPNYWGRVFAPLRSVTCQPRHSRNVAFAGLPHTLYTCSPTVRCPGPLCTTIRLRNVRRVPTFVCRGPAFMHPSWLIPIWSGRPAAACFLHLPFELNLRRPPPSLTQSAIMEAPTRKFLDDRIDILNKGAVSTSPARQVFGTVSAILVLTRVSVLVLLPSVDPR